MREFNEFKQDQGEAAAIWPSRGDESGMIQRFPLLALALAQGIRTAFDRIPAHIPTVPRPIGNGDKGVVSGHRRGDGEGRPRLVRLVVAGASGEGPAAGASVRFVPLS